MNPAGLNERTLVEYLLGRLSESESAHIDERLFTEDGLEEELLATADDLIYAYVKGDLSAEDRGRFEAHFLAVPRHRQRLAFIRDLGVAVEQVGLEHSGTRSERAIVVGLSWKALWPAAAALAVLVTGVLFILGRPAGHERTPVAVLNLRSPSPSPAAKPEPPPSAALPQPTIPQGPSIRVVRLPRDGGTPVRVALAESTRQVQVEVAVPEGPPSFDVVLRGADGTEAWRRESLPPPASGRQLVFSVPAEVLRGDAYTLRIEGEPLRDTAPPVLQYRVRVVRER